MVVYPKSMAKEFLQAFRRLPDSVYASCVYKFKSINYFQPITINGNVGDSYEGARGVGYLRRFFRPDFESYLSLIMKFEACLYSDSLIIMNYLQRYKISVRSLVKKGYNMNLVIPRLTDSTEPLSPFARKALPRWTSIAFASSKVRESVPMMAEPPPSICVQQIR